MTDAHDPFEAVLRPLADEFAAKVAAAITRHLREQVGAEVQAVVERAFSGAIPAPVSVAAPVQLAAPVEEPVTTAAKTPPAAATRPTRRQRAGATAAPKADTSGKRPKQSCSKPGCENAYYYPSGKARLCHQHFLAAGGKTRFGTRAKKSKKN
jgi:hypothetical protein